MSIKTPEERANFEKLVAFEKLGDFSSIIVETSELAIKSLTLDGVISSWNKGAEKIYGYKDYQIIGKHNSVLIADDYHKVFEELIEQFKTGQTIHHYETKSIRKDKRIIDVCLSFAPIKDADGKIIGTVTLDRDVTNTITSNKERQIQNEEKEKRASELLIANKELVFQNKEKGKRAAELIVINKELEAYSNSQKEMSQYVRSLIEASRDPLITISIKGKITDVNEAMTTVTGESREDLINTDFKIYFTNPEKASEIYKEVFRKGFVIDYPLTIIDGELTDVLFNGSVYKDGKGNILGAVIVARDITEQKKIAAELIKAKITAELAATSAENSVKSKQQFLSNMSHEIRTPMNAIIGFTKIVLKTELNTKQKEYLQAIKMSGDALIVLINDILDLAKVDSGKMTFEKSPFKLAMSFSAMLHLFEIKIQEKNLKLIKEYDTRIPEVLLGDSVRLHQILLNLVGNAVKFTSKGTIKVKVALLEENEKNVTLEFSVIDTGIGIANDKLKTIFENFQQASIGTSRLFGGTGLGLAISKQLIEQQGGQISVKSELKKGSTFSFVITLQKTNELVESETEIADEGIKANNIKVLVVEDIALNQFLMKTLMDDFGFEKDIAGNGEIAIKKLQENVYDIILMDLQMPIMNGYEATEYIRKKMKSKIPIIALSADVTSPDIDKCKAAGMNDYISKPVDDRLLFKKIIALVKKPLFVNDIDANAAINAKTKCIDLHYLKTRTKSNPDLMMEMISLYLEQTPPLIRAMKNSMKNKDWDTLQSTAHKMIPSFSIVGIHNKFEKMAKKINEYDHPQLKTNDIEAMVLQLENVLKQACIELKEVFINIKKTKDE